MKTSTTPSTDGQPSLPHASETQATKSPQKIVDQTEILSAKIAELEALLAASTEREKRVLADYQNVVRRSQEDRVRFIKMAASEFVETLLAPLDHLSLAATQLNDAGLNMVITELKQALKEQGLEEIEVIGKPFDISVMEVVDKQGKASKVTSVVSRGYRLNGEVIRHAKVVLGE